MSTFEFQESLPLLPIPALDATLQKYLETVKPFLNEKDFEETTLLVSEFEKSTGPILHQRLLERKSKSDLLTSWSPNYVEYNMSIRDAINMQETNSEVPPTKSSWLIDWWNEYSYLRYRESVVLNVSFFFVFPLDYGSIVRKAASVIYHAEKFRQQLISNTLAPENAGKSKACMQQYRFLFNSCRVPSKPSDKVLLYDPKLNDHVIIMRKNRYYSLKNVSTMSQEDLQQQISHIKEDADSKMSLFPIGILTAADRDSWASNFVAFLEIGQNESLFKLIASSSFVVCLDSATPITREEISHLCWHGYGSNRWYDKICQFIVFQNGRCGFLGEHSMVDATTPSRLCDFVCSNLVKESFIGTTEQQKNLELKPYYLNFQVNDNLLQFMKNTRQKLLSEISKHDLETLKYVRYGKGLIKKLNLSPDSYVQMAIQLAYFRLMGTFCATYESAGMKRYQWGRTETCRSVSSESVEFCKAMEDPSTSIQEKAKLAVEAIQAHSAYMADCVKGNGIDRHFLGLRLSLGKDEPIPPLFVNPSYLLSCHWTLSTSQIPTEFFEGYGWGEVVSDGFGVAYMVRENGLYFNVVGLTGDSVPNLQHTSSSRKERHNPHLKPSPSVTEEGNLNEKNALEFEEDKPYFVDQYKKRRVQWLKSCLEEALDDMQQIFGIPEISETPRRMSTSKRTSSFKFKQQIQGLAMTSTDSKSMERPSRSPSTVSHNSEVGLSLPYPSKSSLHFESEGIIGEDLGYLEFEWGSQFGQSRSGRSDSLSSKKRSVKLLWPFSQK